MTDIRQKYFNRLNVKLSSAVEALAGVIKKAEEESLNDLWIKSKLPVVRLKDVAEFAKNNGLPDGLVRGFIMRRYKVESDDAQLPFEAIVDIINYVRSINRYDILTRFADFIDQKQPTEMGTVGDLIRNSEHSLEQLRKVLSADEYKQLEAAVKPYLDHLRTLPEDKKATMSHLLIAKILARPYVKPNIQVDEPPEISLAPGATPKGIREANAIRDIVRNLPQKPPDKQQAAPGDTSPHPVKKVKEPIKELLKDKEPGVYEVYGKRFGKSSTGRIFPIPKSEDERMRESAQRHEKETEFYRQVMASPYEDESAVTDTRYGKITEDALELAEQWSTSLNRKPTGYYGTFWDKGVVIGLARKHFAKTDSQGNEYLDANSIKSAIALTRMIQTRQMLGHASMQGPEGRSIVERTTADLVRAFSPEDWKKVEETYMQITDKGRKAMDDYDLRQYGMEGAYPGARELVNKLYPENKFDEAHDWRRAAEKELEERTALPFPERQRYRGGTQAPVDPGIEEKRRIGAYLRGEISNLNDPLPPRGEQQVSTHYARPPEPPPEAPKPFDEDAYYRGLSERIYGPHSHRLPVSLLEKINYGLLKGEISIPEFRRYVFSQLVNRYGMAPGIAHSYIDAILNAQPHNLPGRVGNEPLPELYTVLSDFLKEKQQTQGQPPQEQPKPPQEQPTPPPKPSRPLITSIEPQKQQPPSAPLGPNISQGGLPGRPEQGLLAGIPQKPQQPEKPDLVRRLEPSKQDLTRFSPNLA